MSFPKSALFASLSLIALTIAGVARADDPAPATDDKPTEVVVTGSGYRISKDALMSHVDILTRDQIDQ